MTLAVLAATSYAIADDAARMEKLLRETYPSTQIKEVASTPVQGLYEVIMGRNVAYVDESGRYFLFGRLYDMVEQKDLTADRIEYASRIDFAALPLQDAIVEVRGKGTHKLAVFSDPDCPYCKRLERDLHQIEDVTVYTFLYPVDALHPKAREKAIAIWCAQDTLAAWKAWMLEGKEPPKPTATCKHPIDRNVTLAKRLGVDGTPTLFNAEGKRIPGAPPVDALRQFVAARNNTGGGR